MEAPGGGSRNVSNHGGGGVQGRTFKPIGCVASGAYAAGPEEEEGEEEEM